MIDQVAPVSRGAVEIIVARLDFDIEGGVEQRLFDGSKGNFGIPLERFII